MKDAWRHFISEFIGTFALVFIGSGAIIRVAASGGSLGEVALAHGLILSVMVTALLRISGHFNPAITVGFLVTRRIQPMMAVVHWIAHLIGAAIAAHSLQALSA